VPATQPNIVFILADDLGWCDLGAGGSTFYESPRIDRIADEGMRFTQGYATCQVCSPSRASILTGQYTPRHGVTDWIGAPSGRAWHELGRHTRMLPPEYAHGLQAETTTFAKVLQGAGYRTFFAGKWHLGDGESCPENHGFDINVGGYHAGSPRAYFSPYRNPRLDDGPPGESLPLRLGRDTASFIEAHRAAPFLAYLSFYSVHSPLQCTRARWEKFRRKALRQGDPGPRFVFERRLPARRVQDHPVYAGVIEAMDDAVGLVLDALDRNGLSENTIVVFTSDNGGVVSGDCYASSMLPLRGGKGSQWEGGIREPFYVRYPGVTAAGTACDVPVSGIDFYRTFLDLTGQEVPATQTVDGLSLTSLLRGEDAAELGRRDLFWHYPHYGNQGGDPSAIIRRGSWKLIHYFEDGRDALYDLASDPGEQHDRAAAEADRAAALRRRLDAWLREVGARRPEPDPEYDPEKERARLHQLEHECMPALEAEHAAFLAADWEPSADWWGSEVTED
jgi:arylsulfatase A-like enzyme